MSKKYKICKNCANYKYKCWYEPLRGTRMLVGCIFNKCPKSLSGVEKCNDYKSSQRIKPIKNKR